MVGSTKGSGTASDLSANRRGRVGSSGGTAGLDTEETLRDRNGAGAALTAWRRRIASILPGNTTALWDNRTPIGTTAKEDFISKRVKELVKEFGSLVSD